MDSVPLPSARFSSSGLGVSGSVISTGCSGSSLAAGVSGVVAGFCSVPSFPSGSPGEDSSFHARLSGSGSVSAAFSSAVSVISTVADCTLLFSAIPAESVTVFVFCPPADSCGSQCTYISISGSPSVNACTASAAAENGSMVASMAAASIELMILFLQIAERFMVSSSCAVVKSGSVLQPSNQPGLHSILLYSLQFTPG